MTQSRIERMTNEVRITSYGKLAVLTIAAIAAVVILSIASITSGETTAGETDTAPAGEKESFTYFPGQYTNQGTAPSDHVQAF